MLQNEQNAQVCDATKYNRITKAGNKKEKNVQLRETY